MVRRFKQLFQLFSNLGVQQHFKPGRVKSVQLVNQLSLFVAFVSVFFIFMQQDIKPFPVRLIELLAPFVLLCVPLINKFGYLKVAKVLLYLELNVYCFVSALYMGYGSGDHLFFIPIVAGSALVFSLTNIKNLLQALLPPLLSISLLFWFDDSLAIAPERYGKDLEQLYAEQFFITILSTFVLAYFYFQITSQQQAQLHQAIKKQEDLNKHLLRNEKKLKRNLLFSDKLLEKLRNRNDYFKALLQNASDITAVVDDKGHFKYITPSFFRLTGLSPNEIVEKTVFEFVHHDDVQRTLVRFQGILQGQEMPNMFRFRYRKSNGTYMFLEAKGTNLLNEEIVQGIVINALDITDRLHYEEQAREKEKNIRTILDNNDNRIWLLDRNYILLDFNDAFAKTFHASFGNPLQRNINIFNLLPVEAHEKWRKRYQAAENGVVHSYTDRFNLNGEERSFRITIFPVMEEGELDRLTVFAKDITEQEQAEQALIEAKDKAEEATRAKAQFLSTMSHEIRTPMNAVIGMTHLLLEDSPTPDQEENLRILKFSAENLLVLINDILDLSKVEAGKIMLEHAPFHLSQLVSDLNKSMQPAARQKNISLEVLQDTDLPKMVMGDSVRLSQILTNLLSNAIKFTEKGSVQVQVTMLEDAPDATLVQFKVSDTGIGIPPYMQEAIFESFTQGSSDTTRRFGGTGLGLTITKRLLELQDSRIELESKEGEGSVFSFCLRFARPDAVEKKEPEEESGRSLQEFSLHGKRILMVEDNPLNIFVGRKFLEKWGIELHTAENGLQALEILGRQGIDLILMDLQMPEMDGYEATRQIRKLKDAELASLPVLAITAAAEPEVKTRALTAGVNDFVIKPFNPDDLLRQLSRYLATEVKM